jgi:uncharacterized protein (TIGR02246 family)
MAQQQSLEKELIHLENRFWQAIQKKDIEAAVSLTDDPCLVAGSKGVSRIDKEKFRSIMKAATYTLLDFQLKETEVRLLTDDVAILAYTVHEDLTVDGERVSMDASDSSTWIKRKGRWLCAMHTESVFGDPYGRDRAKAA